MCRLLQILNGVYLLSAGPLVTGCILTLVGDWRCLAMFLISGVSSFRALCAVGEELCYVFLTPLDRLLIFLLGDAFAVLGCHFSLDSFFFLSFWRGLIVKVLLRGVLIDRLHALDAVELGGCSFFALVNPARHPLFDD